MMRRQFHFGLVLVILAVLVSPAATRLAQAAHECSSCHVFHNAPGPSLSIAADVETTCLTCHEVGVGPATWASVHKNKTGSSYAAFEMTCADCHTSHSNLDNWLAGTNIMQVGRREDGTGFARISTPSSGIKDVVFQSRGTTVAEPFRYSFGDKDDDGNAVYDGICEVCHTQTGKHKNDGTGSDHYNGETCTDSCHGHDSDFAPTGGTCTGCHGSVQGSRRAVTGEFADISHHADAVTDADCEVCHEQTLHQGGNVRLFNVDTAAVIALTGDPNTSYAEAVKLDLGEFCLACHDGDHPSPFSDGLPAPTVDATAWAASSHRGAPVTCYGDGTFGCHGSGHGSKKIKMLTPYDAAGGGTPNTEEEGFCFTCHNSGGEPAVPDVETPFNPATIRWATDDFGPNGNMNINDRHDIDDTSQGGSGAKIECTDCHDSHTANSSSPPLSRLKADPDPGDGHDPSSSGTYYLTGITDPMSEWCLDCHDASFPATITPPSTVLTDIKTVYSVDTHGDGDPQGTILKTGANYWTDNTTMSCLVCHNTHNSERATYRNLMQLKDVVYGTDGTTPLPADDGPYEVTDNSNKTSATNGQFWCNTCHAAKHADGNKGNCFGSCHQHGVTKF